MTPAEAAIREAMSDLTAGTLHADFLAQACNPTAIHSLLSELDALRARCEAGDALLRESLMICEDCGIDDMVIAIDAHLRGAGRE